MENRVEQVAYSQEERVVNRSLRKLMTPSPIVELTGQAQEHRAEVEMFIADKFLKNHGATLTEFLPTLLSIRYQEGYRAALGLRPAGFEKMFLEQYLDIPAEQAIARLTHSPIDRNNIVEIGNLVSTLPGATALLFLILVAVVHKAGFHYVMFTATPEVKRAIEKLGFVIKTICPADPNKLQGDRGSWGRYYENQPQVMAGFVGESLEACSRNNLMGAILCIHEDRTSRLARSIQKVL